MKKHKKNIYVTVSITMPTPTKVCVKRLNKELRNIMKNPIPQLKTRPLAENILEWHYVIYNLDGCYKDGIYHGVLKFPSDYPYKPPSLRMITPSGRFHINQNAMFKPRVYIFCSGKVARSTPD